jgi:seryl-tRNA synthetase
MEERLMSHLSKVKHSRNQWKHKATQRGARDRYQHTQIARINAERGRTTTALKETQARRKEAQARLSQLESQSQARAVHHKVDLVF